MEHPMGAMLHTGDLGMDDLIRYAQEAEALGYDGFWVTEESGKEAFSVLALLAGATRRIRLGTGIVSFYSRTPTLLAMAASTIHRLSGGRLALGMGTGGIGFVERGHGIAMERPLARARETVAIVRGLLTSKKFSHQGSWFRVRDFHLREGPIQGTLPIYLSALNPKMMSVAAQVADGFIANWPSDEAIAEWQAIVKREAAAVGRDPKSVKIMTLLMTCVDPKDDGAVNAMRKACAFYCASPHYHHVADISGFGPRAREVKAVWDRGNFNGAARMVTDAMVEKVTLTGTPEACRKQLRSMLDQGVYPIIYPVPRHERMVEDYFDAIRLVARYAQ